MPCTDTCGRHGSPSLPRLCGDPAALLRTPPTCRPHKQQVKAFNCPAPVRGSVLGAAPQGVLSHLLPRLLLANIRVSQQRVPWFPPAFTAVLPHCSAATFRSGGSLPLAAVSHQCFLPCCPLKCGDTQVCGPRHMALGGASSSVLKWRTQWGWDVQPSGLSCSSGQGYAGRVAFSLQGDHNRLLGNSCRVG